VSEKAEEEKRRARLRQSDEDFRRLFDQNPLPMYIYDLETLSFLEVNQAAVERYGFSREEFLRMRITDIRPPEEVPRLIEYIAQPLSTVELPGYWRHQRRDGTLMDVNLVLLQLEFGGRPAAQVIVEDITEKLALARGQQQLTEELQRRVQELTTIYRISQRLQRLRRPDLLAEEVLQILRETLVFQHCAVLLVDETNSRLTPFAISLRENDPAAPENLRYRESFSIAEGLTGWVARHGESLRVNNVCADPRYRQVRSDIRSELCVPLRSGGRMIGVVDVESVAPDAWTEGDQRLLETIAAQIGIALENARLYEQLKRHADELEQRVSERTAELCESNAELEAFAYSVSHDLRAPLRAMEGFSQALLEDYLPQLDGTARDYLSRVIAASNRMAELINDLLHLSRITRATMRRESVSLSHLTSAISAELRQAQPQRAVEFVIVPDQIVHGDARLLRVALENLLGNAWKFTIGRNPARIEFGVGQELHGPAWFIRDNGVGFDMQFADKLFTPFQRLHSTHEFPGTGIGLATVHRIIHRHGGRLWTESEAGMGATFFFTLPQATETEISVEVELR
jgi:PAS domain S-box-containing protein